jgi:2-dehydro-3-deoxygluconokinase
VYLARCGAAVNYATLLGDDPYSAGIRALAAEEGVSCGLIGTSAGRMPGLYLIETARNGERSFHYWRERAPARDVFVSPHGPTVAEAMTAARMIYLSGITLSLYDAAGLEAFALALGAAKRAGAKIAMDGNYRPRGWGGDTRRARTVFERFWRLADVALPTYDDEHALWGDASPTATLARLAALGVPEIVAKCGGDGAHVFHAGQTIQVACPALISAIDTTAAGDSFNGAYLAARLAGQTPDAAALHGHRLAGVVIQHRGAIVPKAATDRVLHALRPQRA